MLRADVPGIAVAYPCVSAPTSGLDRPYRARFFVDKRLEWSA